MTRVCQHTLTELAEDQESQLRAKGIVPSVEPAHSGVEVSPELLLQP
jgi:hypothetical protein